MTKQELIAALEKLPDDVIFLVSKDEEGNGYREMSFSGGLEKAYNEGGYEGWQVIHPDDLKNGEFEDYHDVSQDELIDVAVFW